jgi:hypothetical protein
MASTYTPLGIELQATGENAGTWGTKTNTNLSIIEQISGGYSAQSIAGGAQTTTLSVSDGATGAVMSHRMIEFTGTISGNQIVTIPLDAQNFYFLRNSTSGAHTVQFKYASGSGDSFTFSATDKGDQVVFATANDGTNPDIYTMAFGDGDVTLTGTQTLTNKTLTDPILSPGTATAGKIEFLEGTDNGTNKVTLIGPASTADVTVTLPAATDTLVGKATTDTLTNKTLTSPAIGTKISDTNGNELVNLTATGSAVNEFTIANAATGDGPTLSATGETNVDINLNPKGTGTLKSGTAAVKIAGKETIWVPASAMYPNSTSGCADIEQTELSNGPELKTLDFDKDSDEFAQFAVAFPKSWNEGTVTFQAFFTANTTNTGNAVWKLQGVALADNGDLNTAFGTAVGVAKAHSGTANDLDVAAESGAVTIAGSPSTDEYVFFQIFRDANDGDDSLTADAKLLGVKLFFTTDAANDA